MADVNSNININFNTAAALAQLRSLQAGLSKFHQSLAEGNLAAANAQKGLNARLLQSVGATGKFSASQVKVAGSTLAFTSALEKNKLSLREYYRYTMAAATANTRVMGKAFAQEREIINRARRDRVKALQSQYIQMNKANAGFLDAIKIMPKSLQMASGKFTELGTRIQYAAQRQQFLNQLLKQGSTQLLNFGKNTQWAGRQLMVGLTMPLALFGSAAAKAFKELDAEIVKFRRVYGDAFTNDAEVEAAVQNIRRLGTEYTKYGVAVKDTMNMAATAAAAGFTGSDLTAQVETATKLAVLGQVEQQQALETTISLQSAFGISSEELAKKIDFLNAVENQTLLSIEDLTIAIPKAAPVVKQLGGSVEDLAFFLTAMKEGGINASEGANALKSGLASLINPSDKAAKFMGALGINIKGLVEANKGDIKGTVVGFARALDELDPLNRARAIEQMFGKFQFSRLSTLFQNVTKEGSQASRAFDLAGASVEELAIISEREMKKIEDSTGVKFQAAIENFKQEIMPLGKAFLEALTPVVKFFGSMFEKFNGLSDQTKKVVATIVAVVAGLGPVLLMTFGLLANGVANVIKFFAMLRGGIAKLNGQTSVMGAGFNYMTQEQIENAASSQQLHQTHTRLIEVFNVEKSSVSALAASYSSLSTQMRSMAAQNPSLFAGGMGGARRAVSKLPPVKKYVDGVISVPGPKGAGDVVPAMLSPGEAVIPTETTDKYRGLITAMFQDKVPGFMAGRLPGGPGKGIPLSAGPAAFRDAQQAKYRRINDARQGYSGSHSEKQVGSTFVGMPKGYVEASQSRQILDKISNQVKAGRFANVPPTDFGTKLEGFTGYSFPGPSVGGVFRKPNGKIVVVKPTMTEATADAEVRMTQIEAARGMVVPRQTIKTMLDPTDPTGQRKFIVLESPYDPRIASMSGKFSKSDMVKQLVGSAIRGDKDLQKANISGNVVADVGNAGVMDRASGFREFAKTMPSMEEQAMINLLGVKGGAKKFFAQETSSIAAKMTPKEYGAAIRSEINRSIPPIEKIIKSWNLQPDEQIVYNNMLKRLKDGSKVDWAKFQPIHARAGQGVIKAIDGIDPGAMTPEIQEQLNKHASGVTEGRPSQSGQIQRFIDEMDKEYSSHPDPKIKKQYVDNKSKWHDLVKQFQVSPDSQSFQLARTKDGSMTRPFTLEEAKAELRYAMGDSTKNGEPTRRAHTPSTFRRGLEGFGKVSTGSPSHVKTALRNLAKENHSGTTLKMKKVMDDLKIKHNLSESQLKKALRYEAAHIVPSGYAPTDPRNWQNGQVFSEFGVANNFLNTVKNPKNFEKLMNNPKTKLPVSQGGLGYTDARIAQLKQDLMWASSNKHPTTSAEFAKLVRLAEFNTLAGEAKMLSASQMKSVYQAEAVVELGKIRKENGFFNDFHKRVIGLTNKKETVRYGSEKEYLDAQKAHVKTVGKDVVAARKGESIADNSKKTTKKIGNRNSIPMPGNVIPINSKGRATSDNVLVRKSGSQSVTTPTQTARLLRVRGFEDGDKKIGNTGLNNPTAKQGNIAADLRSKGYSQSEINKILMKHAKNEVEAKRKTAAAAEKEARTAQHTQREKENLRRKETETSKRRFVETERRYQLAAAQARTYDAAVKENQSRELKKFKEAQKTAGKEKRMARQQKIGGVSGGLSMGLGTAGMGLMMAGQEKAGMAVMGASAVAGLAPMFAGMGPFGLAITALAATGGGLFLLDRAAKKAAEAQSKLVDQTFATTEKMKGIGALTGKVGASEIYDKKRQANASDRYTTGFDRGKEQFGATFLENEVGKDVMDGFTKSLASGSDTAAKQMAIQLAGYVSDGIMSAEQAHSVASQIGINLNNQTLTSQISGTLLDLIGPSGEDLLKNPLEIRMKLVKEQRGLATNLTDRFEQDMDKESAGGNPINILFEGTRKKMASEIAAMNVQNLEFNRAQEDSLNAQYDKDLKILQTRRAATTDAAKQKDIDGEILALADKREAGLADIRKTNEDIIKDQLRAFKLTEGGQVEGAFMDSLASQVRTKAEADGQGAFADTFLKTSAALDSKEIEVKINTIVASGSMPTATATSLLEMFGDDEDGLDKFLDVTTKMQDPGKVTQLINSLGGFKGGKSKAVVKTIMAKIANGDPEEADKLVSTITLMEKMDGKEINLEAFFEQEDAMDKLKKLQGELEVVENMPTPVTKEVISKLDTDGDGTVENMDSLLAVWDQWGNLPDEIKKTVIQEYITVKKTIGQGDIDAFTKEKVAAAGGAGTVADYWASPAGQAAAADAIATTRAMQSVKQNQASAAAGKYTDPKSGGKKEDPYAFLLSRLKNVRNAAINAAGGIAELNKALAAGNSKSVQNRFIGLEQQMNNMKLNPQFIDFVMGQDSEVQKKYFTNVKANSQVTKGQYKGRFKNPYSTTKTDKLLPKGTKAGDVLLTPEGKTFNQGYDAAVVGEFNVGAQKSLDLINRQEVVRRKLVAAGYDAVAIENILGDEYTTAAIFAGKITQKEIETNVELSKQLTNRQKINNLISNGAQALREQKDITKIPKVIEFLGGQGLSKNSIRDIIGDPGQLSEAIAAMEEYGSTAGMAADRLKEIVDGLKAIEDNAVKRIAIEFAVKTVSEQVSEGAAAANKIMDVKRKAYSYMTASELSGVTAPNKVKGGPVQEVGKTATANVAARYAAAGVKIPTMPAGTTLKSVGKDRANLGQSIALASTKMQDIQGRKSNVQDAISKQEDALSAAIDGVNKKFDDAVKGIQDVIKGYETDIKSIEKTIKGKEDEIKKRFTDKIEVLNKENQVYSNDLAIMDKAAEDINEKYDKQVEALQKVNELNQQIVESQGQQLDLADALTSGDIAAAARAAQEMRATSAAAQGDRMMQGLENSRTNELDSLTGKESGKTRKQISERQFTISQEIYALETDPKRLEIEKEIDGYKQKILDKQALILLEQDKIEAEEVKRIADLAEQQRLHDLAVTANAALLVSITAEETAQAAIVTSLEAADVLLAAQEDYLIAIAEEAVAIDESTGMTLEKWEETEAKVLSIKELSEAYAIALAAAETSAANTATSWTNILDTINKIPASVTTQSIINEIRNITENITRYITTVDLGGSTGNTGNTGNTNKAPGTAWVPDGKGGWTKTAKPGFDYEWDDNKGWTKETKIDPNDGDTILKNAAKAAAEKAAADAKAKAEADAKAAADAATKDLISGGYFFDFGTSYRAKGGLINPMKFAMGGFAKGTDTVPAMLTPGEFIMSKYAVQSHGIDTMKAINSGKPAGGAVYNNTYELTVNAKTDANPNEIAQAVMSTIRQVDDRRIKGVSLNAR